MSDTTAITCQRLFAPHPNLSDDVNHCIVGTEIEGGVHLDSLPPGATIEVETQNRRYTIVNRGDGQAMISGHPEFCPHPVLVMIGGCTWGGSMLKMRYIGRGMHLEFSHPFYQTITTSRIVDIRD